jgi:hypothetical protein
VMRPVEANGALGNVGTVHADQTSSCSGSSPSDDVLPKTLYVALAGKPTEESFHSGALPGWWERVAMLAVVDPHSSPKEGFLL